MTAQDAAGKDASCKKIINRKQLLEMIPLSERTILDMEKKGKFPRRFAITPRLVGWDLADVEAWIEQRKAAAEQPLSPGLRAA